MRRAVLLLPILISQRLFSIGRSGRELIHLFSEQGILDVEVDDDR